MKGRFSLRGHGAEVCSDLFQIGTRLDDSPAQECRSAWNGAAVFGCAHPIKGRRSSSLRQGDANAALSPQYIQSYPDTAGDSGGQCGERRIMRFRLKNDEFPVLRRGDANAARRGRFFLTNIEVYSESFSVSGRDLARKERSARDEAPALCWKVDRVLLIEGC